MDYLHLTRAIATESLNVSKSDRETIIASKGLLTARETHDTFLLIFKFSHFTRLEDFLKMCAWELTRSLELAFWVVSARI
jgi:hypothetical protein